MKLITCLVWLVLASCSYDLTKVYVTCKYPESDTSQVRISIQTQLRMNQKLVSYRKIDTGLYEVTVQEW